jgi:hypothetical protein
MANASEESSGDSTGAGEAWRGTVGDGSAEWFEPEENSEGVRFCDAREEPAAPEEREQPADRSIARKRPRKARGPGCCRSPIMILRHDMPLRGRFDGRLMNSLGRPSGPLNKRAQKVALS